MENEKIRLEAKYQELMQLLDTGVEKITKTLDTDFAKFLENFYQKHETVCKDVVAYSCINFFVSHALDLVSGCTKNEDEFKAYIMYLINVFLQNREPNYGFMYKKEEE